MASRGVEINMKLYGYLWMIAGCCLATAGQPKVAISLPQSSQAPVMEVSGDPGKTYSVEISQDLTTFTSIDTVTLDSDSVLWTVTLSMDMAFFRVVEVTILWRTNLKSMHCLIFSSLRFQRDLS